MDIIDKRIEELNEKIENVRPVIETYFFKQGIDWKKLPNQGVIISHLEELYDFVTEKNILTKLKTYGQRGNNKSGA